MEETEMPYRAKNLQLLQPTTQNRSLERVPVKGPQRAAGKQFNQHANPVLKVTAKGDVDWQNALQSSKKIHPIQQELLSLTTQVKEAGEEDQDQDQSPESRVRV